MEANKKIAVAVTWLIVLIHVMFGDGLSLSATYVYNTHVIMWFLFLDRAIYTAY